MTDEAHGVVVRERVYLDDLDGYGMLHHARFATIIDRAVIDFWLDSGWTPSDRDFVQVVREIHIEYLAPVRGLCDLSVRLRVTDVSESSATYRFEIASDHSATLHARGSRVIVNLDADTLRPSPFPEQMWAVARPLLAEEGRRSRSGERDRGSRKPEDSSVDR